MPNRVREKITKFRRYRNIELYRKGGRTVDEACQNVLDDSVGEDHLTLESLRGSYNSRETMNPSEVLLVAYLYCVLQDFENQPS